MAVDEKSVGHPLFALAFRAGRATELESFAAVETARKDADFVWAHLDLGESGCVDWLRGHGWPEDVTELVTQRVLHGRLYTTDDLVYGHLRDIRHEPEKKTLHAGALSIVISPDMVVTGRRIPLRAIEELRNRVNCARVTIRRSYEILAEFFRALNDIGELLLQHSVERLRQIESKLLKRQGESHREELLEIRREYIRLTRDMTYSRTAMIEIVRECEPPLLSEDEIRQFEHQVHRYAALVEDAHDFSDHTQFLLEELRSQVAESTNRNLYVLTILSTALLPPTLIASLWGMNVKGFPFGEGPLGFWEVAALIAVVGGFIFWVLNRFRHL